MRHLHLLLLTLLLEALLVGCTDDPRSAALEEPGTPATSAPTSTSASVSASTGETIADGTYAKSVTVGDAMAAGITDEEFLNSSNFGSDGHTTFTYKFAGDRWTQFVTLTGAAPEPGDGGPLTYDEDGDAVLTSESDGCPGCVYTYDWHLDGGMLTLTLVGHESSDGPEDLVIVRFITEGDFMSQT